jgi:hypothetical protein
MSCHMITVHPNKTICLSSRRVKPAGYDTCIEVSLPVFFSASGRGATKKSGFAGISRSARNARLCGTPQRAAQSCTITFCLYLFFLFHPVPISRHKSGAIRPIADSTCSPKNPTSPINRNNTEAFRGSWEQIKSRSMSIDGNSLPSTPYDPGAQ